MNEHDENLATCSLWDAICREFSWKGRLSRSGHITRLVIILALMYASISLESQISIPEWAPDVTPEDLMWGTMVLLIVYGWIIGIKRCHDVGLPGSYLVTHPYSSERILFRKGTVGSNEYGADPSAKS